MESVVSVAPSFASNSSAAQIHVKLSRDTLRRIFGRFATGVTVATTIHCGHRCGLTVNSFTSVSLSPPLILICVHRSSRFLRAAVEQGSFAVNIVDDDHLDVAKFFAAPDRGCEDRWPSWEPSPSGAPLLEGAVASLDCVLQATHPGGDHMICVGEVRGVVAAAVGYPLVFVGGHFRSVGPICDPDGEVLKNWVWI
ncbi:MAG: flavin reductase family protein [Acetobacteraceae bacterium]